ncbi:sugar ABC transporter substrate-binding protein [Aliagarivorans marinus]|uniref:sugar ABC transporter substrate-binding protein n=1 Tax=Aliagarivorans marinus TaxID=561965 RepID=UPI0003FB3075|nr:extracellular solute-binding protein [Aliagarivorans marinus]
MRYGLFVTLFASLFTASSIAAELSFFYYREQGKQVFQTLLEQFSQETGHQVALHQVLSSDLQPALVKAALSGQTVDVVFAPSDAISIANIIHLSAVPDAMISEHVPPEQLATTLNQGVVRGIPILQGNHLMLFYNKALVSQPAQTWQALRAQQPALAKQGMRTIGWPYPDMYWFAGFVHSFGGRMTQGQSLTLDSPAMQQALRFYRDLSDSGLIDANCDYACGLQALIDGEVAYAINGEWALAELQQQLGTQLGVTKIPAIGDQHFVPFSSSLVLMFPNDALNGPNGEALAALSQFFQRYDTQLKIYQQTRFLPVHQQLFSELTEQEANNPVLQGSLLQLADAIPMSAESVQNSAWTGMRKGFELYIQGLIDEQQASQFMQQYAERDHRQQRENTP